MTVVVGGAIQWGQGICGGRGHKRRAGGIWYEVLTIVLRQHLLLLLRRRIDRSLEDMTAP